MSIHITFSHRTAVYTALLTILIFFLVVTLMKCSGNKTQYNFVQCFNYEKNLLTIFKNYKENEISCINGLRAFGCFVIVAGHYAEYLSAERVNYCQDSPSYADKNFTVKLFYIFLLNSSIVDVFFAISGTLITQRTLRELRR